MRNIVMLDWDGVVIDHQYQATQDIRALVAELIASGMLIVPNSDTPVTRLQQFCRATLDLEAETVIAERGAIVALGERILHTSSIEGVPEFREQLAQTFKNLGYCAHIGNSTVWVREKKLFEPNTRLVLIDGLREQTLGCFFLITDAAGLPHIDAQWGEEAVRIASAHPLPAGLRAWDYNPSYGIAIANVANVSKADGYRLLRGEYPEARFFMIGDSDSDIIANTEVTHCTVSNCSPGLRARATFVATKPFTEGLAQCLRWISAQ